MNTRKVSRPKSRSHRTAAHVQLEADIAQIERFRAVGLSSLEALAAFRAGLSSTEQRDELAHTAFRELLRGSAVGQVLDEPAMVAAIATTSYRLADAMRVARGSK